MALITENWEGPGLKNLHWDDMGAIRDLLTGHSVAKVAEDHLQLDDGTMLRIVPNDGGCSCGAGDYELANLNGCDNVITNVEFDYSPGGVDYDRCDGAGYYRIYVYAGHEKISLLSVEGDDGNGYYGTGYWILVRPA